MNNKVSKMCNIQKTITFVLLLCIIGCSDRQSGEIISKATLLAHQSPDSALLEINKIVSPSDLSDKLLADYGWIQAYAHNKTAWSMVDDSLVVKSANYYEKNEIKDRLPSVYELVAQYYLANKNTLKAMEAYDKGLLYSKQIGDSIQTAEFYLNKGMLYRDSYNNEDAIYNLRQSLNYNSTSMSHFLLALCENRENRFADRDHDFEIAIEKALSQEQDTLIAAHYLRNYAQILQKQGQYKEAIEKIQQTYSLSDYYRSLFVNHIIMAEIYLSLRNIDSAKYHLALAETSRFNRSFGTETQVYMDTENQLALLRGIINYADKGIVDNSAIGKFNDSIFSGMIEKERILQAGRASQSLLERQNFQLQIRQQKTKSAVVIGGLLAIITILLLFAYLRNKKRQLTGAEERIETLSRLVNEASYVEKGDNNFFKKILLQQLGMIRIIAQTPTESNQKLIRQMARISNKDISVDTLLDWNTLYQVIDSIYSAFYSKLKNSYGSLLSEKEIQLCCLLCADFSSKEIGVVTQQSIPTIYQRKTSIRKKLKMDEAEDIISSLKDSFSHSDPI
jgi:tetratricopeptide (TPR) repeat protein/DNA-binding CsgD family transcriptional regulator